MPRINLFRRSVDTPRPSLRERAALLKASAARVIGKPPPVTMPEVGSPEAVARFHAACREFDRRTHLTEPEYAALRIGGTLTMWTSDQVSAALRGDFSRFSPAEAEAARGVSREDLIDLSVTTLRRELQHAVVRRAVGLDALYALAYPDGEGTEGGEGEDEPDPIFAEIEAHRTAYAAWRPYLDRISNARGTARLAGAMEAGREAAEREAETYAALFANGPRSIPGLVALAQYAPVAVRRKAEDPADSESDALRALYLICGTLCALARVEADARPFDDVDPYTPPPGFMPVPVLHPECYTEIERGLRLEIKRLLDIARAEHSRRIARKPDLSAEDAARIRDRLMLPLLEAAAAGSAAPTAIEPATAQATGPGADADLLALGWRFDEAHAAWMALTPASRAAWERVGAFKARAVAEGMSDLSAMRAAWLQDGVNEATDAEEAAFAKLEPLSEAIMALPAHTPAGLAVKARAATAQLWPSGTYETDRALGEDEEWRPRLIRSVLDACMDLARRQSANGRPADGPAQDSREALREEIILAGHDNLKRSLACCSCEQLDRLYEAWDAIRHHLTMAGNAPCFHVRSSGTDRPIAPSYNAAGLFLDLEYDRAGYWADAIEREARSRSPDDPRERKARLAVMTRHELACSGYIADRALAADLLALADEA